MSAGSLESEVCRGEQLRSLRQKKRVIPLLVKPDADRRVYLEAQQYLDFSDYATYSLRLIDLERAIKSREGATPVPGFKTTRYEIVPPLPQNFVPRPPQNRKRYVTATATADPSGAIRYLRLEWLQSKAKTTIS